MLAGMKKYAHKSPPKGYPKDKNKYAIPDEFKYPIDTKAHVQAAMSYWSNPKNRKGYSMEEQKKIAQRISSAAKKFKKEVNPEKTIGKLAGVKKKKKKNETSKA